MSLEERDNTPVAQQQPEIVKTDQEPVPKISNEHRAMLAESFNSLMAHNNALMGLQVMREKLEVQKALTETQAELQTLKAQKKKAEVEERLNHIKQEYNLPDGADVDPETGLVTLPGQQPGGTQVPTAPPA